MNHDYDVIVIGSGVAGLSAAIAAADAGARVLIVEADKQVGGSSRLRSLYSWGTLLGLSINLVFVTFYPRGGG